MAVDVDICNLALSFIGDAASVTSLSPPDASVQAGYCGRFYPMARDLLQEMHSWNFCTTRGPLALLNNTTTEWQYCYAVPNNALVLLAILDPNATDDYTIGLPPTAQTTFPTYVPVQGTAVYAPQPFIVETLANGTQVIWTNQVSAVLRYTIKVTNAGLFPPSFTTALARLLSSFLAGPIIKGDEGRKEGAGQYEWFTKVDLPFAKFSDANQRSLQLQQSPTWITGRV